MDGHDHVKFHWQHIDKIVIELDIRNDKSSVSQTSLKGLHMIPMIVDRHCTIPFCQCELGTDNRLNAGLLCSVPPLQHDPCCVWVHDCCNDLSIVIIEPECDFSIGPCGL